MKLRTVLAFTMLTFSSLACSGLTTGMPAGLPSASLVEPWGSLGLPTEGGNVLFSSPESVSITFSGNKVKELWPKCSEALKKAGWTKVAEVDNGDTYVLNYQKDGKTCGMAVTFAAGMTTIAATIK